MDRQAWIAVTLCALGLIGWQIYMTKHPPVAPVRVAVAQPSASPSASSSSPQPTANAPAASAPAPSPNAVPVFAEQTTTLKNADVELHVTNRGGGIREALLLNHVAEKQDRVVLNAVDRMPIGAIIETPAALPEFSIAPQSDGAVLLERVTPEHVNVRKRFSIPAAQQKKDNFVVDLTIDFRNDGTQAFTRLDYFVALGSAVPIHPKDLPTYTRMAWSVGGKAKGIDVSWFGAQSYPFIGVQKRAAQEFYTEKFSGAEWAGVTNQFFTTLVTPLNGKVTEVWARRFDVKQPADAPALLGIEGALGMPGFELQPGQTATQKFQIYAGPKLYGQLSKLEHGEADIMDFGILKVVCQALLGFMNLLNGIVHSYGVAIVLMTVLIKAVLWPLQNKANKSMRMMAAVGPQMQALKEKYKDDPTRMNAEVMKLYKERGVNPVGGCLPMVIQIPIFLGLFTMLRQVPELRNAPFLWVHDLSQPDTLFTIPGFGLPVNVLPILMGATQFWLMRMTPKTGDSTQQKVMMFMPLIFLFFCYNFAAALALYYTTQNLLSILQYWLNQKQAGPVLQPVAVPVKRTRKRRS